VLKESLFYSTHVQKLLVADEFTDYMFLFGFGCTAWTLEKLKELMGSG
jgi:hypothetical protein